MSPSDFRIRLDGVDVPSVRLVQFANGASATLMSTQRSARSTSLGDELRYVLRVRLDGLDASRATVHQAVGILEERLGVRIQADVLDGEGVVDVSVGTRRAAIVQAVEDALQDLVPVAVRVRAFAVGALEEDEPKIAVLPPARSVWDRLLDDDEVAA